MLTWTLAHRVWLVLVLGAACAACGGPRATLRSGETGTLPLADRYDTAGRPDAVLGATDRDRLAAAAAAAARDAGVVLRGDGRLAVLARHFAGRCDSHVDARALLEAARRLGLIETSIELACARATGGRALAAALEGELRERLSAERATHYGLFVRDAASAAFVLSRRPVALAPVPRSVQVGSPLRLRGRLDAVFAQPRLVVREPSGGVRSWPAGAGPDFDIQVPTPRAGCYVVSITARRGESTQMLATLIARAGDGGGVAQCAAVPASGVSRQRLATQVRELERRIAELRIASGLPALATDAQLERAADQASTDSDGAPSAPAREFVSGLVLTAVARADDPSSLWKALARDAGMRAKLLNPDVTHLGAGVRAGPDGYTAAVVVARLAPPADLDLAPARVLEAINRNRAARGAEALRPDAELTRVARHAASAFFATPEHSEREIVARANAELERFGLSYRRVAALAMLVSDPLDAAALEPALDADAGSAGIAVARGVRPGSRAHSVAVVIALGWDR